MSRTITLLSLLCFLSFGCSSFVSHSKGVFVLIHGTWGNDSDWHKDGGYFNRAVSKAAKYFDQTVVDFVWSGQPDPKSREQAGSELADFIKKLHEDGLEINIISHSHGSNVAAIASQILVSSNIKIKKLYALATPIDVADNEPNMDVIGEVYNLFSIGDLVQTVLGRYDRIFPPHDRIANVRITINGEHPGHVDIHSFIVGIWIPLIHQIFAEKNVGGFGNFDFSKDQLIAFNNKALPKCSLDHELERLLEKDVHIFRRTLEQISEEEEPVSRFEAFGFNEARRFDQLLRLDARQCHLKDQLIEPQTKLLESLLAD